MTIPENSRFGAAFGAGREGERLRPLPELAAAPITVVCLLETTCCLEKEKEMIIKSVHNQNNESACFLLYTFFITYQAFFNDRRLYKLIQEYRISEWAEFQVWKFLPPKG